MFYFKNSVNKIPGLVLNQILFSLLLPFTLHDSINTIDFFTDGKFCGKLLIKETTG